MISLTEEISLHNSRIDHLIELMMEYGPENPFDVIIYMPLLKNIPIRFENGETWTVTRIRCQTWSKIDNPRIIFEEFFIHFRNADGKRSRYRTYFGGSLDKPQPGKRIVDLYEDELNREWWRRKKPSTILDAIENFYQCRKSEEKKDDNR